MQEVSIFLITSSNAPGKKNKAWYEYMLICQGKVLKEHRDVKEVTGQFLILSCAKEALERMNRSASLIIRTDNQYFLQGCRQLRKWEENQWKRANGKDVCHADLWKEISRLLKNHEFRFIEDNMEIYKTPVY